jgi:hypothetical protein
MEKTKIVGRIVEFHNNKIVVVETVFDKAFVDVNDFNIKLNIGDEIEAEEVSWYVHHGRIVTVLDGYAVGISHIGAGRRLYQIDGKMKVHCDKCDRRICGQGFANDEMAREGIKFCSQNCMEGCG